MGILAVEGGSIPRRREHELCGQQSQTGKGSKRQGQDSSSSHLPAAPSDPWPCSDMSQFRFHCCNSSIQRAGFTKMQLESRSPIAGTAPSRAASAHRALALHPHPGWAQPGPKNLKKGSPGMCPSLSPCVHPSLSVTHVPSHKGILPAPSSPLPHRQNPPGWASSRPQPAQEVTWAGNSGSLARNPHHAASSITSTAGSAALWSHGMVLGGKRP